MTTPPGFSEVCWGQSCKKLVSGATIKIQFISFSLHLTLIKIKYNEYDYSPVMYSITFS